MGHGFESRQRHGVVSVSQSISEIVCLQIKGGELRKKHMEGLK
jgi:hypothetical protein